MAKRKKRKSSRKSTKNNKKNNKNNKPQFELKEGIVGQIVAIVFLLLSVILVASWFTNASGSNLIADIVRWLVGGAIFAAPVILIYLAVRIFREESHTLPTSTKVGSLLVLFLIASLAHLPVDATESWEVAGQGKGGGVVGHLVATPMQSLFGWVAAVLLVGLLVVSLSILLNAKPSDMVAKFKKKKAEKQEKEAEQPKIESPQIKPTLNANVPVESASKSKRSLKDSAHTPAAESREALTMSVDPEWNFPETKILDSTVEKADAGDWKHNVDTIRDTLKDFKIDAQMGEVNLGPRVTQYTLVPESGIRLNKITQLEQNIALNLAAQSIRIEAPIPGKRAVGIEVPNKKAATVRMRGILESSAWDNSRSPLSFSLGQDISGEPMVGQLDSMPHLLIAGQTGSGKSVMINALLTSLLYRNSPADMKLILVDPKQVELNLYADIPHLLTPVITDTEKTVSALKWAVEEMERRLSEFASIGKRNIADYNTAKRKDGDEAGETMPYIVIVIDELSDLMIVAAREVESLIVRLAQKARATGIHLVLATQRPSVDVITGLIKANIPARIAFTVASQVDSRTILDQMGAEKLLGEGDMLYVTPAISKPKRIQGVFISDKEVNAVVDHLRGEAEPDYNDDVISQPVQIGGKGSVMETVDESDEDLFREAVEEVLQAGKASTSFLQRKFRIGYNRAARLLDIMEEQGIVGPQDGHKARPVLISSLDDIYGDEETTEDY